MIDKEPVLKDLSNPPKIVKYLQDSNADHPVYERKDITHGVNCKCCTSIEVSAQFGEEYRKKIQELHKGRNEGRRLAKIARIQQQQATQTQQQQPEHQDFRPLFIKELED